MKEPRRLYEQSESAWERALLRSGRANAPRAAKQRAMAATAAVMTASSLAAGSAGATASSVAAGGAPTGASSLTAGTVATAAKLGSLVVLKWVGIAAIAGAGMVTGTVAVREMRATPPRAPAPPAVPASAPHAEVARGAESSRPEDPANNGPAELETGVSMPAPIEPRPAPAGPRMVPVANGAAQRPEAGPDTLSAELMELDEARRAIAAGEPAHALAILDRRLLRFPRGSMGPEAAVLRVEALLKAGDPAAAQRVAQELLTGDPYGPYAARVRSLLSPPAGP